MFFKIFCVFLIFLHFIFCDTDFLNEPISNSVLFTERENHILFAMSKTANETIFTNLINNFLKLEQYIFELYYDITLTFGIGYKKNITRDEILNKKYGSPWCTVNDKCFEKSRVANVEQVVTEFVIFNDSCPQRAYKKFVIIISDVCLPSLNKQLDDYDKCGAEYRKIILMLPTENDVDKCKKQLGKQQYIEFFSSEFKSNELETYSDMYVLYQTTWSKSIFNVLVVVDSIYEKALEKLLDASEINYSDFELCHQGSMASYFQFTNEEFQLTANKTAPVNSAFAKYTIEKYRPLSYHMSDINCDFINSFLITMRDMPLEDGKYQYNLLILSEPIPKCLTSDLLWNNTNRHFELVVIGILKPQEDHSKFIAFANNSLNHVSYYTLSEGRKSQFWQNASICRTRMPAKIIADDSKPQLITTTTTSTTPTTSTTTTTTPLNRLSSDRAMDTYWWSCGIFNTYWSFCIDIFQLTPWSHTTPSSFINKAFPDIFVEEENVIINFDEIFGQGSTCTVYQAKIKTLEEKSFAIKIPLQYDDSRLEEVMHELNIVQRLGSHPSICLPILCTTYREIPCIIFDKMDSSLLTFIQNYFENGTNFPPKTLFLQILWQISNALEFVASKNIIHRDIAARNILFSAPNIAKLSDFGLWCECNTDSQIYFSSFRKKLPFKWLSIEAMKDKIFSEKSDVWSFGIVMYEMWSGGKVPYADVDANELMEFLMEGHRLEPPETMESGVSEIMKSCWKEEKGERPNFYGLKTSIRKLLKNERTEKYNRIG